MKHQMIRVSSVEAPNNGFLLRVHFDDGTVKNINIEPVLYDELYAHLSRKKLFDNVTVDVEVGTPVWPNGAGFDLDMLYLWDDYVDAFSTQMKQAEQSDRKFPECA
ncbi:MAG: DUF2442 domain-containing protein [Chlorobiales bacterium]|nr:DUF2442 domain-containing protein [Chlorobiales bacterium]